MASLQDGAEERLKSFEKEAGVKCLPISSLLDQGIDELLYQCADLLEKTPLFPLFDAEEYTLHRTPAPYRVHPAKPDRDKWPYAKNFPHKYEADGQAGYAEFLSRVGIFPFR